MKLNSLSESIDSKIDLLCNSAIKDSDLHCQVVSKNDLLKTIGTLQPDKIDDDARMCCLIIVSIVLIITSCVFFCSALFLVMPIPC